MVKSLNDLDDQQRRCSKSDLDNTATVFAVMWVTIIICKQSVLFGNYECVLI